MTNATFDGLNSTNNIYILKKYVSDTSTVMFNYETSSVKGNADTFMLLRKKKLALIHSFQTLQL